MNWLFELNKEHINYEFVLRYPNFSQELKLMPDLFLTPTLNIGLIFSNIRDKESLILLTSLLLNDLNFESKIFFKVEKIGKGKKYLSLLVKSKKNKSFFFLDFFFNIIIKSLKRRFIIIKSSISNQNILNFRFSYLNDLEIDDYLFFDFYEWFNFLNFYLFFSKHKKINKFFINYFYTVFQFEKLSYYEIFNRKG